MYFLSSLIWPIIILLLIGGALRRFRSRRKEEGKKDRLLQVALSKEDAFAQWYLLLSVTFFSLGLFAFNKNFGNLVMPVTIVLISSVVALIVGYKFRSLYTIAVGIIGSLTWAGLKFSEWGLQKDIKAITYVSFLLLTAVALYLIGRAHEGPLSRRRLMLAYVLLGFFGTTGFLFIVSSKAGLAGFADMLRGEMLLASWQITVMYIIAVGAVLGLLVHLTLYRKLRWFETAIASILSALFIIFLFIPEQMMFISGSSYYYWDYWSSGRALSGTGILWAALFNGLLLAELLSMVFIGYIKRERWVVNLGIFLVFIFVVVKYFDYFWSLIDRSIILIVSGFLFLGLGWLMEWGRRYLLARFNIGASS